ncbi:7686_t:CDS:2, partial [Racocetra persica]
KESTPKESSLVHIEPQKIEEEQKVEQDLICELLEFIRYHNSTYLPNSISSKHIPDILVDADLTPGSVSHLAHLFNKAEKTIWIEKMPDVRIGTLQTSKTNKTN